MDLDTFAKSFRDAAPTFGHIPNGVKACYKIQDVTGVTWFRMKMFQVEMFIVPPHYIIPEHKHPNVDSYEMYLGGDIAFSHSGKWVAEGGVIKNPKTSDARGDLIKVRTTDAHGGVFGENGGVFMSIQEWLNDVEPHSVALDYDGVAMGESHLQDVKYGEATAKEELTWRDAATLETNEPVFLVI